LLGGNHVAFLGPAAEAIFLSLEPEHRSVRPFNAIELDCLAAALDRLVIDLETEFAGLLHDPRLAPVVPGLSVNEGRSTDCHDERQPPDHQNDFRGQLPTASKPRSVHATGEFPRYRVAP